MERRRFLKGVVAAGLGGASAAGAQPDAGQKAGSGAERTPGGSDELPLLRNPGRRSGDMLYRTLGGTGAEVSAIAFGGSHFAKKALSESRSIQLVHAAIDRGITFMDNCWDYNDGQSEIRMGKALAQGGRRQKVFLETKIDGRTKELAAKQIDESLRRLKTDHVDLLMHHEVLRFDDPDRIFGEGGAQEAVEAARAAGKVRFIGFTGHKDPHVHLYMLDVARKHGVRFDAVLMPSNVMDAHFRSFARLVMPRLVSEGVGVMTMKPFGGADGIILKSRTVEPVDCLRYALSLASDVVITGLDRPEIIDQALSVTRTFQPLDRAQLAELLRKTEQVAATGQFELFKTSAHFDGTATHPDWLGGESPKVKSLAPQNAG
jgi:uncharacterized protein